MLRVTSGDKNAARLAALGAGVSLLWAVEVDHDDPAQAEASTAYYLTADGIMALIEATPAADLPGLKIKAQAVAWCCASQTDFALGDTSEAKLIGSLLRDLLAA